MASNKFLSIPYLLLRSSTAGGGLAFGLIQTFVFARILTPERFSAFILVGTLGVSLWLLELGMSKVVFVRTRAWFLSGRDDSKPAEQATAVVTLYALLALAGSILCFVISIVWSSSSMFGAFEFSLFFLFTSLNLVWSAIRNISVAVDDFIAFESLEAGRRLGHIAVMLATLAGLSLLGFLLIANLIWVVLFAIAAIRLVRKRALTPQIRGFTEKVKTFFRENRKDVFQTGTYALNEFYLYNFPYLIVPIIFGLGAPIILIDTVFKMFRGATVLYSAGCDLAVPRQTRAFIEGDKRTLILATLMAAGLSSLPAIIMCGLLLVAADQFFALLLGPAATMPPSASWILIVMLIANLVQTVSNFLLAHTGFFRQMAWLSFAVSIAMTLATAGAVLARLDLMEFLTVYAAVYVCSALLYAALAIQGPFRATAT